MKMKKMLAIFVAAVFLLSLVPAAFADSGREKARGQEQKAIKDKYNDNYDKESDDDKEEKGADDDDKYEAYDKEKPLEQKDYKDEHKETYKLAKEKYSEDKKKLPQLKETLKSCSDLSVANCKEAKGKFDAAVQNAINMVVSRLESIRGQILSRGKEGYSNVPATEEEMSIAAQAFEFEKEIKDALIGMESATTKDAYKSALKNLKDVIKRARDFVQSVSPKMLSDKFGGILEKAEQLSTKLDKMLAKLAENGKDTSSIKPLIDTFDQKIAESRKNFESAKSKYASGMKEESKKDLREAYNLLKEAHEALKQIHQAFKNKKVDVSSTKEKDIAVST